MTIDEAIEELRNFNSESFIARYVAFSGALQLGIEALKLIAQEPPYGYTCIPRPLPGETTE